MKLPTFKEFLRRSEMTANERKTNEDRDRIGNEEHRD